MTQSDLQQLNELRSELRALKSENEILRRRVESAARRNINGDLLPSPFDVFERVSST